MGRAYGNLGGWGDEGCIRGYGGKKKKRISHLEDVGVNRKTVLKQNFENRMAGLDWMDLAQYRNVVA